jgi:hypothetical protein
MDARTEPKKTYKRSGKVSKNECKRIEQHMAKRQDLAAGNMPFIWRSSRYITSGRNMFNRFVGT